MVFEGILLKNIGLYLVAVCLITYYGVEVCPFLGQIDVYELIVAMSLGLGQALIMGHLLQSE